MKLRTGLITGGAAAAAVVLMLSLGWGLQHAAMNSPQVLGHAAPALTIEQIDGEQVAVHTLEGQPIVLNFWASWCLPCTQELSVLIAGHDSHPTLRFIGAAMQDSTAGVKEFEIRHPHPYPVGPIVGGSYQAYGVLGPPSTFFINSDGVVVASFSGPLDAQTLDHYMRLIS